VDEMSSKSGCSLKKKMHLLQLRVQNDMNKISKAKKISNGELATGIEPMSPEKFHIGQNPM